MSRRIILTDLRNAASIAYVEIKLLCVTCDGRGHEKVYIACPKHAKLWAMGSLGHDEDLPCGCKVDNGVIRPPSQCGQCTGNGFVPRLVKLDDLIEYIQTRPPKVRLD